MNAVVDADLLHLITSWLPYQRWFAGKGRDIAAVDVESSSVLLDDGADDVHVRHIVVRVDDADGGSDRYQLLLGTRTGDVPQRLQHAVIGAADGWAVYDAVHDEEATAALLTRMVNRDDLDTMRFGLLSEDVHADQRSRVLGGEQSNTSIVYGDDYILKSSGGCSRGSTRTSRSPGHWRMQAVRTSRRRWPGWTAMSTVTRRRWA